MAVNLVEPTQVYPVKGVQLATASAGIRYQGRDDLLLIQLDERAEVAAVFTKNKFCAAPVQVAKRHLGSTATKYLIINAGNANAGTGQAGIRTAKETTQLLAQVMDAKCEQVLPFSTGVIGESLDVNKISQQLSALKDGLSEDNWLSAARAIMTTDTLAKACSEMVTVNNQDIHITGISKGSGMIQPNMATMLAYIATDLAIEKQQLQELLVQAVDCSFNAITVDSDTSTNDACVLMATGASTLEFDSLSADDQALFSDALRRVMQTLAQAIVRDGEGATKFVTVNVESARDNEQARKIAYSVANSPLVKTALFASDPNWGRIMAAAGKCDDESLDLSQACLLINSTEILRRGEIVPSYTEEVGKQAMSDSEIEVTLQINQGAAQQVVWTTDLSHEYVTINADYRS